MKRGLFASCRVVDRCWCVTNIAGWSDADLPAQSVFILWRVLSETCYSMQWQTSTRVWSQPTVPDVVRNDGEKPGEESCSIWDTVMWATWRAQHMNASSPVSVLARATVIALRHDGRKLKPIERDNCQSSIFDLFDIYTLKYRFSLFAMTSVRWRKWIGPSCLYPGNQSLHCNDAMSDF